MQKDLEYWQIDELILEPCCALKYYPEIELCVKEQKGEQEAKAKEAQRKPVYSDSILLSEYSYSSLSTTLLFCYENLVKPYHFHIRQGRMRKGGGA